MKNFIDYYKEQYLHSAGPGSKSGPDGLFYGYDPTNKEAIFLDRNASATGNGFLLGCLGSAVPATAKQEMLNLFLTTRDEIIVIDFFGEYTDFARRVGGQVLPISAGKGVYINPLEIIPPIKPLDPEIQDNPIHRKADFMCALCSVALGHNTELTPLQCSVIHNTITQNYSFYNTALEHHPLEAKQCTPVLTTFFNALSHFKGDYDSSKFAHTLSHFWCDALSMFEKHSNIRATNRFTVYDLSQVPYPLRGVAYLCVAEYVWEHIRAYTFGETRTNHAWLYFSDITLFLTTEYSSNYLRNIFLRSWCRGCNVTIISRDVPSILFNPTGQQLLLEASFIQLMKQEIFVQDKISDFFSLTPKEKLRITDGKAGEGLIITETAKLLFENTTQTDLNLFEAFS